MNNMSHYLENFCQLENPSSFSEPPSAPLSNFKVGRRNSFLVQQM